MTGLQRDMSIQITQASAYAAHSNLWRGNFCPKLMPILQKLTQPCCRMGQRGVAALAAAVVAGAVRPLADGNNMKES